MTVNFYRSSSFDPARLLYRPSVGNQMETILPLTVSIFQCEKCDFITSNKKDYNRHIRSVKHIKRTVETASSKELPQNVDFTPHALSSEIQHPVQNYPRASGAGAGAGAGTGVETVIHKCNRCSQIYQSKSGLWKHSKTCNHTDSIVGHNTNNDHHLKVMMIDMIKNNQDFQHKVLEMMCNTSTTAPHYSEITNSNNYNGTNNSHNNTFHLQIFLNEKCKDAMNMSDFVNSITLKISDLEEFGKLGYVEGMSKIIIDNLRDTDIHKRPVHCSDAKRETIYVKDADRWEREGPENTKMTNAVRVVEHKNISLVNEWARKNPKCEDSSTKENTQYINISRAVLDGDDKNIAKVIKRVSREVVIDK